RLGNDLVIALILFDYTYFLSNFWVQRINYFSNFLTYNQFYFVKNLIGNDLVTEFNSLLCLIFIVF
ncbi:hypothetical protein, partial [Capnocytophaga sp. oral taxon 326]|uniref:hypothetical protein n=1 Tax=Capnocytophaga sp. oral taxon 326 TaxID=712212 RepID=UPI001E5495C6